MFASISRGFGFIKQSLAMAAADRDLIKPSLMLVLVSFVISLIAVVPMVAVGLTLQGDLQQALLYILGALLIFVQYVVSYFFGGMTIALIYQYLTQGDGRIPDAINTVKRNAGGIFVLAAVSTVVKLIEGAARNRKSLLGNIFAGILEAVWTTATFFILPAMIIESLSFGAAIKRSAMMIKNNLLLVGVSYIGVGTVVGLFSFLIFIVALGIAILLFAALAPIHIAVGIAAAVIVFGTAIALLSAATQYFNTAYYTSLFMWARGVEQAQQQGVAPQQVAAPAPLAAVLG